MLSLGAGVQSTTLLLLIAHGELPMIDAAIFADTGWEPEAVYRHLDRIEREIATPAGIPLHRVSNGHRDPCGSLLDDAVIGDDFVERIDLTAQFSRVTRTIDLFHRYAQRAGWLVLTVTPTRVEMSFAPANSISISLPAPRGPVAVIAGDRSTPDQTHNGAGARMPAPCRLTERG
ncbi:hypothetical protein [Nocardia sp. NBC_00511]|uniref:hypothetical protein n=1 Tax=Nocardia sp. NBC_00511 TaxID=2903591 RepID=UPI0030E1E3E6